MQQTLALDGREYSNMVSNSDVFPSITVHYEWNVNKFQPDMVDPSAYDQLGVDGMGRDRATFDITTVTRELQIHLQELLEQLRKITSETSDENKRRIEKLEKDLINLMKMIDQEREDTVDKTNASYKLLEEAKAFIKNQENQLLEETNGLKVQIGILEEQIKKYDEELVEEARKNRDLQKKSKAESKGAKKADSDEAKAKRRGLKKEVDDLINQIILGDTLQNMRDAKKAMKGVSGEGGTTAIFDDVISEDEKIRDKKIQIEESRHRVYRNNNAVLASKEFDLKLLEQERDKTQNSIDKLALR